MNCCENCFIDIEIKAIVKGKKKRGNCDICGKERVYICDIKDDDLKNSFENLLDIYVPVESIASNFPKDEINLLKNFLRSEWQIFNLEESQIYSFLCAMFPEKYQDNPALFNKPVVVKGSVDQEYLRKFSILGNRQWEDFVQEIKYKNRFHSTIINKNILKIILEAAIKKYKAGVKFYRARIWYDNNGFGKKEMGAPPSLKASAGRANSEGISCLYLAESPETTLHETKAAAYDRISVATFKLLEDIEVVNLAAIDKISPFLRDDCMLLAINLPHLRKIDQEISKPLRRQDSLLDYLPTQYISDFIKNEGFAGIEYKSVMRENGYNLAIFDEKLFKCIDVKSYEVKGLSYNYKKDE